MILIFLIRKGYVDFLVKTYVLESEFHDSFAPTVFGYVPYLLC